MTFTPRLLITFIAVLAGLAVAPILPKKVDLRPTAVAKELPTFVGDWFGEYQAVSQRELDVLAKDTKFLRRVYTTMEGKSITVSIVISGQEQGSSLHRPERCLPAQGWTVNRSQKSALKIPGLTLNELPLVELQNYAFTEIPPQAGNKALKEGGTHRVHNLNQYFFVGADSITRSHYKRTFVDMWDRVIMGQSQQWAYVTFAMNYGERIVPSVGDTPEDREKREKLIEAERQDADKTLRAFMAEILPEILPKWRAGS